MNIICLLLFCQISISSLIEGLGHDDYNVRVQSYKQLLKIKHSDLQILELNTKNEDIEIALSCRRLINEYFYVRGPNGQLPNIWYLPHDVRFPKGIEYDVTPSKYTPGHMSYKITKYPQDVSLDYVIKALDLKGIWLCEFCGSYIECSDCLSLFLEPCKFCCADYNYPALNNEDEILSLATDLFIKDMLKNGVERSKIQEIINQTCNNMSRPLEYCWIDGTIDDKQCPERYLTYAKVIQSIRFLK